MLARSPSALKKRRYRKRLRDGALLLSRRLDEGLALQRDELTRAGERILREFIDRWREW